MDFDKEVEEALPLIDEISKQSLRRKVRQVWVYAAESSAFDSIHDVPFSKLYPGEIGEMKLIDHIDAVGATAAMIADYVNEGQEAPVVDRDLVIAGALLHDVSKLHEIEPQGKSVVKTEMGELIGHPYYSTHLLNRESLPVELQYIVLSHTTSTGIGIKTLESLVVWMADQLVVNSVFWREEGILSPHFADGPLG